MLFQLKETISAAFISLMQDEEERFCMKARDLVLQVVQAFVSNSSCSQETLKLTSEEGSCKHGYQSGSTEKMPVTEDVTEIVGNNFCASFLYYSMLTILVCIIVFECIFGIFLLNRRFSSNEKETHRTGI
jgi:hypothetical protein